MSNKKTPDPKGAARELFGHASEYVKQRDLLRADIREARRAMRDVQRDAIQKSNEAFHLADAIAKLLKLPVLQVMEALDSGVAFEDLAREQPRKVPLGVAAIETPAPPRSILEILADRGRCHYG